MRALERGVSLGLRVSWRIVRPIAAVVIVAAALRKGPPALARAVARAIVEQDRTARDQAELALGVG